MTHVNKKELVQLLIKYDHHYHTIGEPLVSDDEYDKLKEQLYNLDPKHKYFRRVGADLPNSIKLPYYMGSMNKIRDDPKILDNWLSKYNNQDFIIMEKLDGISAMYIVDENKLYTRGNGTNGSDISFVLSYISIPAFAQNIKAVRGELVIPKSKFETHMGTNPRNTVAGLMNSKVLNKKLLKLIDFVVYQVIDPIFKIEEGLKEINDNVVVYRKSQTISIPFLKETLMDMKMKSKYEIDGIVICDNSTTYTIENGNNPKHAFAFKTLDQHEVKNVIVTDVEWNISKDGIYKPRVLFNTTYIDGAFISVATGYNAKFIYDNGIGINSEIEIIRSGAVIPKIINIIKKTNAKMPPMDTWKWNDTQVEALYIGNTSNQQQEISQISHFFKQLHIKNMAEGTIKKLHSHNFKTIEQILSIQNTSQLENIEGFGKKTIDTIIQNIHLAKTHTNLAEIMSASNIFGRTLGIKKLQLVVDNIPTIIHNDNDIQITDLTSINGIGEKNAQQIKNNITTFREFYHTYFKTPNTPNIPNNIPNIDDRLKGKTVVFTGFRDKELEKSIIQNKGKVVSTVSSKVDIVLTKDIHGKSNTLKKAKELNITILDKQSLHHTHPTTP
jgi:DNA ligase (NAD+)